MGLLNMNQGQQTGGLLGQMQGMPQGGMQPQQGMQQSSGYAPPTQTPDGHPIPPELQQAMVYMNTEATQQERQAFTQQMTQAISQNIQNPQEQQVAIQFFMSEMAKGGQQQPMQG
jgi:hypothetical protein